MHQMLIALAHPFAAVGSHAILAQAHRHGTAIELRAALLGTREGHILAIAKKVLHAVEACRGVVGRGLLVVDIKIGHQQRHGLVTLGVGERCGALAGRHGDDIVVIHAVRREAADVVACGTRLHVARGIEHIASCGSGIALVVGERIEVVLVEYPLRSAVVGEAVVDGRELPFVEALACQEHV